MTTIPTLFNIVKYCKIFIAFIIIALFTSCEKDEYSQDVSPIEISNSQYRISIDEALASLNDVLKISYPDKIKHIESSAINTKIVKSRELYGERAIMTRNQSIPNPHDTVLYIVTFPNNEGMAVLSADSRIPERVLVVTDRGSADDTLYEQYIHGESDASDLPEGFSLYNAEKDDYYVSNRTFNPAITLSFDYASTVLATELEPVDYSSTNHYEEAHRVTPLLETLWTQSPPFNNEASEKNLSMRGYNGRAPAGCVNVALGQIMAYHEYPQPFVADGWVVDWEAAKRNYYLDITNNSLVTSSSESDKAHVAKLMSFIGDHTQTLYNGKWSFALPSNAAEFLEEIALYPDVEHHREYRAEDIITMIDNSCPVFVASTGDIISGHAWVIDGYIQRDRVCIMYNDNEYHSTTRTPEYFVHCNFGWAGLSNGYYTSGIFDVIDTPQYRENYESNYGDKGDKGYTYDKLFYTITYSNPK